MFLRELSTYVSASCSTLLSFLMIQLEQLIFWVTSIFICPKNPSFKHTSDPFSHSPPIQWNIVKITVLWEAQRLHCHPSASTVDVRRLLGDDLAGEKQHHRRHHEYDRRRKSELKERHFLRFPWNSCVFQRKCDQYWPSCSGSPQNHGSYQVGLVSESSSTHFVHRILSLRIAKCVPPVGL